MKLQEFEPGPLDHWITLPEVNPPAIWQSLFANHLHHLRRHTAVTTKVGPSRRLAKHIVTVYLCPYLYPGTDEPSRLSRWPSAKSLAT